MTRQSIPCHANYQTSARNISMRRQNFSSTAPFQRMQSPSKPQINDPAESRLNRQIHENHQIDHIHQIYHWIILALVFARKNEEISEE